MVLGVAAAWEFPIRGAVAGKAGSEVANVTNEQDQVSVNLANARASSTGAG